MLLSKAQKQDIEMFFIVCPDHYSFEDSFVLIVKQMVQYRPCMDTIEFRKAVYNYMDEIYELI
jgi:hypothetical protein